METLASLSKLYIEKADSPISQIVKGLELNVIGKPMGDILIDENLKNSLIELLIADQEEIVDSKIEGVYFTKKGEFQCEPPIYSVQKDKYFPFVGGKIIEVKRRQQGEINMTTISVYLKRVLNWAVSERLIDINVQATIKEVLSHYAYGEKCNEKEVIEKKEQYLSEVRREYTEEVDALYKEIEKAQSRKMQAEAKRGRIVWVIYKDKHRRHLCISEANKKAFEKLADLIYKIRKAKIEIETMRRERDKLSKQVAPLFKDKDIQSICKDDVWFYMMKPHTYAWVDGKRLKEECPTIFKKYGEDREMWAGIYTLTDDYREQIKAKLQGDEYVHRNKYGKRIEDDDFY